MRESAADGRGNDGWRLPRGNVIRRHSKMFETTFMARKKVAGRARRVWRGAGGAGPWDSARRGSRTAPPAPRRPAPHSEPLASLRIYSAETPQCATRVRPARLAKFYPEIPSQ